MSAPSSVPRDPSVSRPSSVRIRRIREGDQVALLGFYAGLSVESRRRRFFSFSPGLTPAQAAAFCTTDHHHEEGFVAVIGSGASASHRIVGHLCLEPDGRDAAELAIAVSDDYQHLGIGRRLLAVGAAWVARERIDHLSATMLTTNAPMRRLLAGLGRPMRDRWAGAGLTTVSTDAPDALADRAIRP